MYLYKNETDKDYTLMMGIDLTTVVIGSGIRTFANDVSLTVDEDLLLQEMVKRMGVEVIASRLKEVK